MGQSTTQSEKSPAATPDDFDFLFGTWRIHNRRLDDPFGDRESWTEITETSAQWEQSFSFDGGKTFVPNWIMLHERVSSADVRSELG
jgi:hypothetical protein